jgi:hypothetical protein
MKLNVFLDGTIDVKFDKSSVYYLKKHKWNYKKIEVQLKHIEYKGNNLPCDNRVENAQLPVYNKGFSFFYHVKGRRFFQ